MSYPFWQNILFDWSDFAKDRKSLTIQIYYKVVFGITQKSLKIQFIFQIGSITVYIMSETFLMQKVKC